ncbi:substrate-binding domain-containing protein [Nocardia sp. NPDC056100]|uniref:substrate-binding domain-containing protein n=1 Tax=Nocardia sp. NPDC056100 TaxID=3345712 RepID=UPI0035DCEF38
MVAVIVLVLAVVGWIWLQQRSKDKDSAAASSCAGGAVTLNVTVDPDIVAPVKTAAERYNQTKPIVRDHCAQVAVNPQPSAAMIAAFTSTNPWDPSLGAQPALWIPDSSRSIELMRVPGLIGGTPAPVAVSPIALGVPDQLRQAMETAQVHWADLARLQQGSLSDIGLAAWGGLKLAMPGGDSALAVAAAVGSGVSGTDPLDENAVRSGQVISAVSLLAANAPSVKDTQTALADLATADPAAPVHAVPATEHQIRARNGLSAFRPSENGPVADFPAAQITGAWVDQTQNSVAGLFADFLRAPEQSKLFTDNGFGAAPPNTATVAAKPVLTQLQQILTHPVLGVSSTVLLDASSSMSTLDGATTRLANAGVAVQSTMGVMPPEFGLGVWEYAKSLDGQNPYKILTPTAPLTDAQRTAITQSLSTVTADASKTDRAYPTIEAAYRNAVSNYAKARSNTILLITDGPEDDSPVTGDQLLADIAAAGDPAHPVRVDVIVIGGPGTQTLQTLTQRTGGTYTKVASSNDLAFGTAVSKALTTP